MAVPIRKSDMEFVQQLPLLNIGGAQLSHITIHTTVEPPMHFMLLVSPLLFKVFGPLLRILLVSPLLFRVFGPLLHILRTLSGVFVISK